MFFQAVFCARPELVQIPTGLGHPYNGNIQVSALHHGLQGGKNFLVGQISGGPEKYQRVRMFVAHEPAP